MLPYRLYSLSKKVLFRDTRLEDEDKILTRLFIYLYLLT